MSSASEESTVEQTRARDDALGLCTACNGKFSEHEHSIHAFTQREGVLVTQASVREAEEKRKAAPPSTKYTSELLNRLIQVLHTNATIDDEDLMFITGIKGEVPHGDGAGTVDGE